MASEAQIQNVMGDEGISEQGLSIMVSLMIIIAHRYGDITAEQATSALEMTLAQYASRVAYARVFGQLYATEDYATIKKLTNKMEGSWPTTEKSANG